MSWYNTEGNSSLHAIRSETQYIRNFQAIPFMSSADEKQKDQIIPKLRKLLEANGFKKEAMPSTPLHYLSYAEKGFIDIYPEVSQKKSFSPELYFNEPCSLAVSIGGRDMLVIRSLLSGLAVTETRSIAIEAEELFDAQFEFAYSPSFGYLSPILKHCGSGEIFSALLFLPAASALGEIASISLFCRNHGAFLSPMFDYKGNLGDMFTVIFSPSHLCEGGAAAQGFHTLIAKIIEKEKNLEGIIFAKEGRIVVDRAYRALGTMLYAKRLDEKEFLSLLSSARLCLAAPEQLCPPPISLTALNFLLAEGLNFSVCASSENVTSEDDIAECRSHLVRKILTSDKNSAHTSISENLT